MIEFSRSVSVLVLLLLVVFVIASPPSPDRSDQMEGFEAPPPPLCRLQEIPPLRDSTGTSNRSPFTPESINQYRFDGIPEANTPINPDHLNSNVV